MAATAVVQQQSGSNSVRYLLKKKDKPTVPTWMRHKSYFESRMCFPHELELVLLLLEKEFLEKILLSCKHLKFDLNPKPLHKHQNLWDKVSCRLTCRISWISKTLNLFLFNTVKKKVKASVIAFGLKCAYLSFPWLKMLNQNQKAADSVFLISLPFLFWHRV